jgi:cysteine-rich repeat protein
MLGFKVMNSSRSRCCALAALCMLLTTASCQTDGDPNAGRVALALDGQFFPGELTSLDLFIYDAAEVECDDVTGTLSSEPTNFVNSQTNVSLVEPTELTFELPRDEDYVVYARAGQRDGGSFDVVAQGCTAVAMGRQTQISVYLHRLESCGDDDVDLQEMCDDGNLTDGDGCDAHCATEGQWANEGGNFQSERQHSPIAAGQADLVAVCWRSENIRSHQLPYAWFSASGGEGTPTLYADDWSRRDCTDVDVHNDNVIMAFFDGDDDDDDRDNMLVGWQGSSPIEPIQLGLRWDTDTVIGFLNDTDIVAVNQTPSGLQLHSIQIEEGAFVTTGETTAVDDSSTAQTAPTVAVGDGNFVVAWQSGTDVYARFFDDIESPSATQSLCEGASQCGEPDVATLGGTSGDQFLVVYQGTDHQISGRFISMLGNASNEFVISDSTNCREPVVAPLDGADNSYLVAWSQPVNPSSGDYPAHVWARVVRTGGDGSETHRFGTIATGTALTTEPVQVSPAGDTDYDQPAVATGFGTSDTSRAIVFYRDIAGIAGADGDDTDIGYRILRIPQVSPGL